MSQNERTAVKAMIGGDFAPLVEHLAEASKSKAPNLTEIPCGEFNEGEEFTGTCQTCGHSQEAHEFAEVKSNGIEVSTDGTISRLIGISKKNPTLAPGLYALRSSMVGFLLQHLDPFELPAKVYGDCHKFSRRILKTFSLLGRGVGVLLSGDKGTGKTLTAKILALQAMKQGIPVISIDQPFSGPGMLSFLDQLPNRCMFLIDEWEKVYASEDKRKFFLGVLDGTSRSRHLWVMTANTDKVGQFFLSRPGRIRYHKKYEGLPEGYIRGIVSDHIQDIELRNAVITAAQSIYNISPDALMAMIEESVLHNEKPEHYMEFFNVVPEEPNYDVEVTFRHVILDIPADEAKRWQAEGQDHYRTMLRRVKDCQSTINGYINEMEDWKEGVQDDFPEFMPFVSDQVYTTRKEWVDPFEYESNGKLWVSVNYLFYGEEVTRPGAGYATRPTVNFRIASDDIKEIVREGTRITVIAKNGDKIVATPAKKFSSSGWNRKSDPYAMMD